MNNIYIVYGKSKFLINKKIKKILKEAKINFDKISYDFDNADLNFIFEEVSMQSLFSSNKAIIISNSYFLTGKKVQDKEKIEQIKDIVTSVLESNIIFFTVITEKLDSRKKIVKELSEKAEVIEINDLTESELKNMISKICSAKKYKIDNQTISKLIKNTDYNVGLIYQELSKLMTYTIYSKDIVYDEVKDLLFFEEKEEIFDLTGAIMKYNKKDALIAYEKLISKKEEPVKIIAMLGNQLRLILQTKILIEHKYSEKKIAAELGVHPYRIKLAHESSKNFTKDKLKHYLLELENTDFLIKKGETKGHVELELFLINI